jgi:hypothetical protein
MERAERKILLNSVQTKKEHIKARSDSHRISQICRKETGHRK